MAVVLTAVAVGQIVLAFVFYNEAGIAGLRATGWAFWALSAVFGWWPILTFRKKGGVSNGKSYIHTTVLVDSGPYALVRHPQYLAGVFIAIALALIAQHWMVTLVGLAAICIYYLNTAQEERSCIQKFGKPYEDYMERVPGMNIILGAGRWIRHQFFLRG